MADRGLIVDGCQDIDVAKIIRGEYSLISQNHGRPVFRRNEELEKGVDVLIYWWNDKESPAFSGWWFGPKVGGDQVWVFHPDQKEDIPPAFGWRCPFDAGIDPSIKLRTKKAPEAEVPVDTSSAPPVAKRRWGRGKSDAPAEEKKRPLQTPLPQAPQALVNNKWAKRAVPAEDLEAKADAELDSSRKRELNFIRQKREEESRKVGEQKAVTEVRNVIQKLKLVKPANFIPLTAELEHVFKRHEEAAGSQKVALKFEVDTALAQAKQRVDEINEAARKEKEDHLNSTKKMKGLVEDLARLVDLVESKNEPLEDTISELHRIRSLSEADSKAYNSKILELITAARAAHEACLQLVTESKPSMENAEQLLKEAFPEVQDKITTLLVRANDAARVRNVAAQGAGKALAGAGKRLAKQAVAAKYFGGQEAVFKMYDNDGDGLLNHEEMVTYAGGEHGFRLLPPMLSRIFKGPEFVDKLKGVPSHLFPQFKVSLGIERELERDAKRRKLREQEHDRLAEEHDAWLRELQDILAKVEEAEEKHAMVIAEIGRLTDRSKDISIEQLSENATEAEALLKCALEEGASLRELVGNAGRSRADQKKLLDFVGKKNLVQALTKDVLNKIGKMSGSLTQPGSLQRSFNTFVPQEAKRREEAAKESAKRAEEAVTARAAAQAYVDELRATFQRYDEDADGLLNQAEVAAYAQGEFHFQASAGSLQRVFASRVPNCEKGIPFESFPQLRLAVGIERELNRDTLRRSSREDGERLLEERRQAWPLEIVEMAMSVIAAEDKVAKLVAKVDLLPDLIKDISAADCMARAEELGEVLRPLDEELSSLRKKVDIVSPERQPPRLLAEVKDKVVEAKDIIERVDKLCAMVKHAAARQVSFQARLGAKSRAEKERLHVHARIVKVLCAHADSLAQNDDGIFEGLAGADGGDAIGLLKFLSFLEARWGTATEFPREAATNWFDHQAGAGKEVLTCERFLKIIRVQYKVVKPAVMYGEGACKVLRMLTVGEVIELCGRPNISKDSSGVIRQSRLKGKALKDDIIGFITADNDGNRFLGNRTSAVGDPEQSVISAEVAPPAEPLATPPQSATLVASVASIPTVPDAGAATPPAAVDVNKQGTATANGIALVD